MPAKRRQPSKAAREPKPLTPAKAMLLALRALESIHSTESADGQEGVDGDTALIDRAKAALKGALANPGTDALPRFFIMGNEASGGRWLVHTQHPTFASPLMSENISDIVWFSEGKSAKDWDARGVALKAASAWLKQLAKQLRAADRN